MSENEDFNARIMKESELIIKPLGNPSVVNYGSNTKDNKDINSEDDDRKQLVLSFFTDNQITIPNKLEELLNSITFGVEQTKLLIILLIYSFSEGYCMLTNSLVVPILDKKWSLSEFEKSFMGGSIFLGFMIGSCLVGLISDQWGRKKAFIFGCCFSLVATIIGIFINSSTQYVLSNMTIGMGIGISVPSAMTLVGEISNCNIRARILGIVGLMYPTGGISGCLIAKFNQTYNYQTNNWVVLHEIRCIAFFIVICLAYFIVESPKFYITNHESDKGFDILEELIDSKIDPETRLLIVKQTHELEPVSKSKFKTYIDMFNSKNCSLSLMLFLLCYCGSYVYYGLIYILPSVLEEHHKNDFKGQIQPSNFKWLHIRNFKSNMLTASQYDIILSDIIMTCAFEIPSDISNGFTPNVKWIGRKGAISVGFLMSAVFASLCIIHPQFMTIYSCFLRFFINISYNILYVFFTEAYPTYMRSTAVGLCTFFSRFGGFTTPFFCDYLFLMKAIYPYIGFFIVSTIGFIVSHFSLPFETLDRITY